MKKKIFYIVVGLSTVLIACSSQSSSTEVLQNKGIEFTKEETKIEENVEKEIEEKTEEVILQEKMEVKAEQETKIEPEIQEERAVENVTEEIVVARGTLLEEDLLIEIRGILITPGENMADYVEQLGEPDEYSAVPSCVEEGDDKVYIYGGIIVYTYRAEGKDRINLIEITGMENISQGIHIGSTQEEVLLAYGNSFVMNGDEMIYELNDKVLGIRVTDGKVSFIEIFAR